MLIFAFSQIHGVIFLLLLVTSLALWQRMQMYFLITNLNTYLVGFAWRIDLFYKMISNPVCDHSLFSYASPKGAQSRLNGLKSLAKLFNFVVF